MAANPIPGILPNQNITIVSSPTGPVPSPQACIIAGSFQQRVTFTNSSSGPVQISFVPDPVPSAPIVFNPPPTLPNNGLPSAPLPPLVANGSVNYYIQQGGVSSGPFAIQVGTGPLNLMVSSSGGQLICTPSKVAVPTYNSQLQIGGALALYSDTPSNPYPVYWQGGVDPFGNLNSADGRPHTDTTATQVADYDYTVQAPVERHRFPDAAGGGGTVKIRD